MGESLNEMYALAVYFGCYNWFFFHNVIQFLTRCSAVCNNMMNFEKDNRWIGQNESS